MTSYLELRDQLPQPTRPANFSDMTTPKSHMPEERHSQQIQHPEVILELPQPWKPICDTAPEDKHPHHLQDNEPLLHLQPSSTSSESESDRSSEEWEIIDDMSYVPLELEEKHAHYLHFSKSSHHLQPSGPLHNHSTSSESIMSCEERLNTDYTSYVPWAHEDKHPHHFQDLEPSHHFQPSRPLHNRSISSESWMSSEERINETMTATTNGEAEEAVEELVLILVECLEQLDTTNRGFLLKKFFSEIEKEKPLEGFIVERLKHSKVKAISDLLEEHPECLQGQVNSEEVNVQNTTQGDVNVDSMALNNFHGTVRQLSRKLERFKVKTINLGGVDQDEKKLQRFKVKTINLGGVVQDEKK